MLMASFLLNYALLRKYVRMYVGRKHAADLLPRSAGGTPKQAKDPSFLPRGDNETRTHATFWGAKWILNVRDQDALLNENEKQTFRKSYVHHRT